MAVEQTREATLGILTYLILGAALGASILLGTIVLGLESVGDLIGAGFRERIVEGAAQVLYLYAFFVAAPLVALVIAALLGMRAAQTGHDIGRTAAATTVYGLPLLWINLAVAILLATALLDWTGATEDRFEVTLRVVLESVVFLLLATVVTAVSAAVLAGVVREAFEVGTRGTPARRTATVATPPPVAAAPPPPEPVLEAETVSKGETETEHVLGLGPASAGGTLTDHPIECPRCQTGFTVSGTRPLRIECPSCGKTGMIQ